MKQAVVELKCDRCKRVEYKRVEGDPEEKTLPMLELTLRAAEPKTLDLNVQFQDLCDPCRATVINYIEHIGKAPKGKSPERKARKGGPQDPPETDLPSSEPPAAAPIGRSSPSR